MDLGQTTRRWGRSVRAALSGLSARATATADAARASADGAAAAHHMPRWLKYAAVVLVLLVLFYPLRACWVDTIDDDTAFWPAHIAQGQSAGVAVMAALINREVNQHSWVVASPVFTPTGMFLDDMPNFQRGLIAGIARFAPLLKDHMGRAGVVIDPDLAMATEALAYPPDVWMWSWSNSIVPTGSSAGTYEEAMNALLRYNARLAQRMAVFTATADNLAAAVDAVAGDLDRASDTIDNGVIGMGALSANDIFYQSKGRIYAEYLVLKGFGRDFAAAIAGHKATPLWNAMMADLKMASEVRSGAVRSGSPGVLPQPCDLCTQGFFILRARLAATRLAETLRK